MKKTAIIVMVLAITGAASAALATNNGGFDVNAAGWNASGGGGAWAPGHVVTGGNPGGYLTLQSANSTWSVWYQVIKEDLAVWGIPAGTTISVKTDMIDLGLVGNNAICGLKIESYTSSGTKIEEFPKEFTVTNSWATYSFDYPIPSTATSVLLVLTNVNYNNLGVAKFGYDNAAISIPGSSPALFPIPTTGNTAVAPAADVLSWTNPTPYNPSETILCDVWFRTSSAPLADPNLVPGQPGAVQIVNDEAISSLDLSTKGITLVADRYYYWKVNVIDPNNGFPKQTDGFTWSFYTGDAAPIVNAGADQYVWLTAGTKTFTLTGSYTDDGKSAVTTTWTLNPLTQTDPATVTTIATPSVAQGIKTSGTHATTVTVNNTGWFFFDFTATDLAGSGVDTVNVGVYVDACEAANQDPADIPARYPGGTGDITGDCHVDLNDFAIMAETWIDCMSAKMGCNP